MLQIHQIRPEDVDFCGFFKTAAFPQSELDKCRIDSCLSGLGALPFGFIQFIHRSQFLWINMEQRHKQVIKDVSVPFFKHFVGSAVIPTYASPNKFAEATSPKLLHESIYLKYMAIGIY